MPSYLSRFGSTRNLDERLMQQTRAHIVRLQDVELRDANKIPSDRIELSSDPMPTSDGKTFFVQHDKQATTKSRHFISRHRLIDGRGRYYDFPALDDDYCSCHYCQLLIYAIDDTRLGVLTISYDNDYLRQFVVRLSDEKATASVMARAEHDGIPDGISNFGATGPHPSGHVVFYAGFGHGISELMIMPADIARGAVANGRPPHACRLRGNLFDFVTHRTSGCLYFFASTLTTGVRGVYGITSTGQARQCSDLTTVVGLEWPTAPIDASGCWCALRPEDARQVEYRVSDGSHNIPRTLFFFAARQTIWLGGERSRVRSSFGRVTFPYTDYATATGYRASERKRMRKNELLHLVTVEMRDFLLCPTADPSLLRCSYAPLELPYGTYENMRLGHGAHSVLARFRYLNNVDAVIHVRSAFSQEIPSLFDLCAAVVYANLKNRERRTSKWLQHMFGGSGDCLR